MHFAVIFYFAQKGGIVLSDLYNRIKNLCKEAGFKNVTELCRVAGIPRSSLSELNMGRSETLSYPTLQKIATACHVTVEEITSGEKEKPANEGELDKKATIINAVDKIDGDEFWEILDELRARPEMRMLFHSAKGATADQLKAIAQMIDGFKG